MRICIQFQVRQWKPWYARFNRTFAYASRKIEVVIVGYYGIIL